eukprot:CAMPEP_0194047750 /NCGR_PEP_ID=MMETSP0009_2-20130614/25397_1 /TAXON_ID=210454 /ORGANISM="Grammatophora oceanica, Strain CCMP 410" /LENGTH=162 /DNA_ID=CAMNT_0038693447 /DNA_START=23 /DNA_END=511 /DNA_ORIENTATION=+
MGETKQSQRQAKLDVDHKLAQSIPPRELLEELAVTCANDPSPDNTFQYAFALSKSSEKTELRYSVTILDGLVKEGYSHQLDCMFGAATALYLLEDFEAARERCESILRTKPENRAAAEMHLACMGSQEAKVDKQVKRAATVGSIAMAAVGVAAVVASVALKK